MRLTASTFERKQSEEIKVASVDKKYLEDKKDRQLKEKESIRVRIDCQQMQYNFTKDAEYRRKCLSTVEKSLDERFFQSPSGAECYIISHGEQQFPISSNV